METPVSVAIVEDEKDSAIKLKKYLEKYAEENALKVETAAFSCGENFLSSKKKFDVVFMDIEMPGDDGLKVVKTLRSEGSDVLVVFCTNLAQYAVNGYEVAAFDFMVKPVTYFDFRMKFDRVINCLNSRKKREVWVASRQGKRLAKNGSNTSKLCGTRSFTIRLTATLRVRERSKALRKFSLRPRLRCAISVTLSTLRS